MRTCQAWSDGKRTVVLGHSTIALRFRTGPGIQSQKFLNGSGGDAVEPIGRLVETLSDTDALRLKRALAISGYCAAFGRRRMASRGRGTNRYRGSALRAKRRVGHCEGSGRTSIIASAGDCRL